LSFFFLFLFLFLGLGGEGDDLYETTNARQTQAVPGTEDTAVVSVPKAMLWFPSPEVSSEWLKGQRAPSSPLALTLFCARHQVRAYQTARAPVLSSVT